MSLNKKKKKKKKKELRKKKRSRERFDRGESNDDYCAVAIKVIPFS